MKGMCQFELNHTFPVVLKDWQRKEKRTVQKQSPEVFYKKGVLKNSAKFTGK